MPDDYSPQHDDGSDQQPPDDTGYWLPDHVAISGSQIRDGFHYVPGELLIREQDYEEPERGFRRILDEHDFRPHSKESRGARDDRSVPPEERRDPPGVPGLVLLTMRARDDRHRREVPRILDTVRVSNRAMRAPQVAPNHVFFGAFHNMWGPARPVAPARRRPTIPTDGPGEGVRIVVLDTGSVERSSGDFDEPDEDGDEKLDYEAGHGVFIEGVIRRYAPGAEIRHKRVLTSNGRVSDTSLAAELAEVVAEGAVDIVNLSLGGYTYDNRGAYAFNRVLSQLRRTNPDVALVAAAGNDHTDRPFFPAATKGVIAVAAYNPDDSNKRARYSNFGWWVDVRAKGDHDSTFYDLDEGDRYADLEAPGGLTLASFDGYANWAGTSFAAPVMTGAIAARMTEAQLASARDAARLLMNEAADTYRPELGVLIEPKDYST
jgi:subtilisin family serine protease